MRYIFYLSFVVFILSCSYRKAIKKSVESNLSVADCDSIANLGAVEDTTYEEDVDKSTLPGFGIGSGVKGYGDGVEYTELKSVKQNTSTIKSVIPVEPVIKFGSLVYNIPDTMDLGKTYIVKFRINRDTSKKDIFVGIKPYMKSVIRTTSQMLVQVKDPSPDNDKAFDILQTTTDIQDVDNDGYTEWVYSITPKKNGSHELNVVIQIIRGNNKKDIVYENIVWIKNKPMVIIKGFWEENWKWVISTLGSIITFLLSFFGIKKWKENREDKSEDE